MKKSTFSYHNQILFYFLDILTLTLLESIKVIQKKPDFKYKIDTSPNKEMK